MIKKQEKTIRKNNKNNKYYRNINNYIEKNIENFSDTKTSSFKIGMEHALYLSGFGVGLSGIGLSEESIMALIATKLNLEYQSEISRMECQTNERIAEIYASAASDDYE